MTATKFTTALAVVAAVALTPMAATPAFAQEGPSRISAECQRGAIIGGIGAGILGAVLSKDKNRWENGAIAAAGGVVAGCMVSKTVAGNGATRTAALQKRAIESGRPVTETWRNADGRTVEATASPYTVRSRTSNQCRRADVRTWTEGYGDGYLRGDVYCQDRRGDWKPVAA